MSALKIVVESQERSMLSNTVRVRFAQEWKWDKRRTSQSYLPWQTRFTEDANNPRLKFAFLISFRWCCVPPEVLSRPIKKDQSPGQPECGSNEAKVYSTVRLLWATTTRIVMIRATTPMKVQNMAKSYTIKDALGICIEERLDRQAVHMSCLQMRELSIPKGGNSVSEQSDTEENKEGLILPEVLGNADTIVFKYVHGLDGEERGPNVKRKSDGDIPGNIRPTAHRNSYTSAHKRRRQLARPK